MKRNIITQAGSQKMSAPGDSSHDQQSGTKRQPRTMSTSATPSWTKYIDSRMKQFSAGR